MCISIEPKIPVIKYYIYNDLKIFIYLIFQIFNLFYYF